MQKSQHSASKFGPGFKKTSNRVYVYEPLVQNGGLQNGHSNAQPSPHPTTVLIFGWADAQPRHLVKYTDAYKDLYPSARIIVVTAETMATFFGGQTSAMNSVKTMVLHDLLPQIHKDATSQPESPKEMLLLHAFSNSGGINLEAVSKVYMKLSGSSNPMPYTALILDSTPGGCFFWKELPRWARGVNLGFAPAFPWPAQFSLYLSYIWVILTMGLPMLFGYQNISARVRAWINNPETFSTDGRRLYLYSESDPLIGYRDVEQHAAEAGATGYPVHLHKFQDSTHCGHVRLHPQEYWDAVTSLWKTAVVTQAAK